MSSHANLKKRRPAPQIISIPHPPDGKEGHATPPAQPGHHNSSTNELWVEVQQVQSSSHSNAGSSTTSHRGWTHNPYEGSGDRSLHSSRASSVARQGYSRGPLMHDDVDEKDDNESGSSAQQLHFRSNSPLSERSSSIGLYRVNTDQLMMLEEDDEELGRLPRYSARRPSSSSPPGVNVHISRRSSMKSSGVSPTSRTGGSAVNFTVHASDLGLQEMGFDGSSSASSSNQNLNYNFAGDVSNSSHHPLEDDGSEETIQVTRVPTALRLHANPDDAPPFMEGRTLPEKDMGSNTTYNTVPNITAEEMERLLEENEGKGKELTCPPGFYFSLYDAGIQHHYYAASQDIVITPGSIKYIHLYEKYGLQTRFRFQICKRFLSKKCSNESNCNYIHSKVVPDSTVVHINENSITPIHNHHAFGGGVEEFSPEELRGGKNENKYPTLPGGFIISVYPPNSSSNNNNNNNNNQLHDPQLIPSEELLLTVGGTKIIHSLQNRHAATAGNSSTSASRANHANSVNPVIKGRHCAHFQFKKMCNLGSKCGFIHSLVPYVQGVVNQPLLINNNNNSHTNNTNTNNNSLTAAPPGMNPNSNKNNNITNNNNTNNNNPPNVVIYTMNSPPFYSGNAATSMPAYHGGNVGPSAVYYDPQPQMNSFYPNHNPYGGNFVQNNNNNNNNMGQGNPYNGMAIYRNDNNMMMNNNYY
ncbi:hypothetical protein ADEAN_000016300 [Angomonas deanei]|uniref:C3H1-type domain-containing protein n=1 Tax=Angomonas deanei TaxID=59799 RepID=A0A7G2C0P2_9TRYP|nr:hypothetical protein ADEAN_000016300 [Angomonas deanei]